MKEKLQWPETLRELMRLRGEMTPLALSREIKLSHVAIGNWLNNGTQARGDNLKTLARFFGVTVDELLEQKVTVYPPHRDEGFQLAEQAKPVGDKMTRAKELQKKIEELQREMNSAINELTGINSSHPQDTHHISDERREAIKKRGILPREIQELSLKRGQSS